MVMETAILSVPVFSTLCNETFRLRRAIFVDEQKVPEAEEFDADDLNAHHLVAVTAGEVSGTLRVIYAEEHGPRRWRCAPSRPCRRHRPYAPRRRHRYV